MTFTVYEIKSDNKRVYIGRTNNLKRRQSEHNRNLKKLYTLYTETILRGSNGSKPKIKPLYQFLLEKGTTTVELITIKEFRTKIEAKRYEMLLILLDWFYNRELIQKVPSISDR